MSTLRAATHVGLEEWRFGHVLVAVDLKHEAVAAMTEPLAGINLTFRPNSYFWPLDFESRLLTRIKGAERRDAVRRIIEQDGLDAVPQFLAKAGLTDEERNSISRIHPAFMGGEFLPDMHEGEVEIARITIASVTQDVTSVYVRRGKGCLLYRVVDEYEGETLAKPNKRRSKEPLTLGSLESFFNHAWGLFGVLGMNFDDSDRCTLERIQSFVISVDSKFYPQIDELYRARITTWAEARYGEAWRERAREDLGDSEPQ